MNPADRTKDGAADEARPPCICSVFALCLSWICSAFSAVIAYQGHHTLNWINADIHLNPETRMGQGSPLGIQWTSNTQAIGK